MKTSNLRILIYSNPLVVDKIAKKFQYWKDSGFVYTKQLVKNMPEDYRFYWCLPNNIKDYSWFTEANSNIEIIPYPYSTSIHQNRYNFSIDTLNKHFTYAYDIDAILNNQPEVTESLRVWAENQRRENPIIFSFYHWIDCKESQQFAENLKGYGLRQIEAIHTNNSYGMFHNEYAKNLLFNEARDLVSSNYLDGLEKKCRYFHPSSTIFASKKFELPTNKKIILFNHRLNNTTNWKEIITILEKIYLIRQDFILWITDDTKLKEMEYLKNIPFVHVQNLRDEEYGYVLNEAHFSICNHKGYSTWNMAVIDSIANGCVALIPDREVYKDMFKNSIKVIGDYISHNEDNLEEKIIQLLNNSKSFNRFLAHKMVGLDNELFEFLDHKRIIDIILKNKVINSVPKKYDNVYQYILSNNGAYKKDWVNEFWSFHVNSNFPKIRSLLLSSDDIYDDTASSITSYKVKI